MFKQLIAATIAATVSFTVPQTVHAQDRVKWYVARFGSEPCVNLRNIGKNPDKRLYYESGPFGTPEEFAMWYRSTGQVFVLSSWTDVPKRLQSVMEAYRQYDGDDYTLFVFFNDKDACLDMMSHIDR